MNVCYLVKGLAEFLIVRASSEFEFVENYKFVRFWSFCIQKQSESLSLNL